MEDIQKADGMEDRNDLYFLKVYNNINESNPRR